VPYIPQNKLHSTSLPQQPIGADKAPLPAIGRGPLDVPPRENKSRQGLRILNRISPIKWSYDPDRVIKLMYPQLKLHTDEHTRGLVSDDTPNA
jgi:hypothetical protein